MHTETHNSLSSSTDLAPAPLIGWHGYNEQGCRTDHLTYYWIPGGRALCVCLCVCVRRSLRSLNSTWRMTEIPVAAVDQWILYGP